MPDWFTSLRQLTRIDMSGAPRLGFCSWWTCLSQLQHLDLRCYGLKLAEDVMNLAEAPHLTYLCLADLGSGKWHIEDPSAECVQILESLAAAIQTSHAQPSKLFRINIDSYKFEWQANALIGLILVSSMRKKIAW